MYCHLGALKSHTAFFFWMGAYSLGEHRAILVECKALLVEYRALLVEYWACLADYRALLMECKAVVEWGLTGWVC